jgi:hypothetical protein
MFCDVIGSARIEGLGRRFTTVSDDLHLTPAGLFDLHRFQPHGAVMRQQAVAALVTVTLSYSTFGADLPVKASDAPASYNWTGYHAGAHLDYQAGESRWLESRFGAPSTAGEFDLAKG